MSKQKRYLKAKEEFDKVVTPDVLLEAEELSKKLRKISFEELNKKFTY